MKKNTLRTKITLTIAGLFAMAGVFYAANPTSFAPVLAPIGVAAAPDLLLVTENCSQNIDTIDCFGNVSTLAAIPGNGGSGGCAEKYLAIAPFQSANTGFTPRDIFVTQGAEITKFREALSAFLRRSLARQTTTPGSRSTTRAHLGGT